MPLEWINETTTSYPGWLNWPDFTLEPGIGDTDNAHPSKLWYRPNNCEILHLPIHTEAGM